MKLENVTESARWYDDACGTALAMQLVGERWSLLIVREMLYGPRRFSELRLGLPGISANTLTQRLGTLERAAIVRRRMLPQPASVQVYELTPWGYASETAIVELGRWATHSPLHDPKLFMSGASLIVSMRIFFLPERAATMTARIGVHLGPDRFILTIAGGPFEVQRGEAEDADLLISADIAMPIFMMIYGHRPLAECEANGLRIGGDRALAEQFAALFRTPPRIG